MAVLIGDQFKFYHDTAENWTTPSWVEIPCVENMSLNESPNEIAINCRGNKRIRYEGGRIDTELTYTLLYGSGGTATETFREALRTSLEATPPTPMHIAFADGVVNTDATADVGTTYFEGDWICTGFDLTADLDDAASYDVTMRLADTGENPGYTEIQVP